MQIAKILWHDRDEHGAIVVKPRTTTTHAEEFRDEWRTWGLSDEQIEHKYDEFWIIEGERHRLEMEANTSLNREAKINEIDAKVAKFRQELIRRRTWGR